MPSLSAYTQRHIFAWRDPRDNGILNGMIKILVYIFGFKIFLSPFYEQLQLW